MLDQNVSITTGGSTYYYHADGLGSVRNLSDSNEDAQNAYDYFAFGSVYGNPTENITQPFRFTGRRWDSERGEYFYRFRNYAPVTGKFFSRDPIGYEDGMCLYVYVSSNPVMNLDPRGLGVPGRLQTYSLSESRVVCCVLRFFGADITWCTGAEKQCMKNCSNLYTGIAEVGNFEICEAMCQLAQALCAFNRNCRLNAAWIEIE